jgi:hypothetical protein
MGQCRLREAISERTLDPSQKLVGLSKWYHCTFTVLSKCTDSETLEM